MAKDYQDMVIQAIPFISKEFELPLSSSEQIVWIKLIKSRHPFNTMSDWKLLTEMRISISTCYCNAGLNACSFDEMWLTFLMKEMFHRQWKPDTKEWIEMG